MIYLAIDVTAVIISAIGAVVSLGTVFLTLLLNKKVTAIHKDVNGKMEHLLQSVGEAEKAKGKEEGIQQQKDESATTADDVVTAIKKDPNIEITKTKK